MTNYNLSEIDVTTLQTSVKSLRSVVQQIHDGGFMSGGICEQYDLNTNAPSIYLGGIMKSWPLYSGNVLFPVPMPFTRYLPKFLRSELAEVYYRTAKNGTRFTGRGKEYRLSLCQHCIDVIENEIALRELSDKGIHVVV